MAKHRVEKVLIGGGSGTLGRAVSDLLSRKGLEVSWLSRSPENRSDYPAFHWDADEGIIDRRALEEADIVINLAGADIAEKRWTDERKNLLYKSRVYTNRLLNDSLQGMKNPPHTFISASATGYYGDRGDRLLSEEDGPGENFLAQLVQDWEAAMEPEKDSNVRKVIFRMGIVLTTQSGFLKEVTRPMKFGAGAWFGDGKQYVSWIHIDDLANLYLFAIQNRDLAGIYNAVSDEPARNRELMKRIRRKAYPYALLAPVPEFALRLAFGEMADSLLDSTCVANAKIFQEGFHFNYGKLDAALEELFD